jgi:Domain of unknown function (DUF4326)
MTTRIQRSRRKGSRLPEGAVCITRPGPYGNPFRPSLFSEHPDPKRAAVMAFRHWLRFDPDGKKLSERARQELKGKTLACWCKPTDVCHGDALIDAAEGRL